MPPAPEATPLPPTPEANPLPLLIVGGDSDFNTQRIVDQAHLRGLDYHFWDTDVAGADQIAWDYEQPWIDLGSERFAPRAIFLRHNVFSPLNASDPTIFDVVQAFALAWPNIRILNRRCLTDANSKARNLRIAKDLGMPIPTTLVMANLTPIHQLPSPDRHILKPLHGGAHTVTAEQWRRQDQDQDQDYEQETETETEHEPPSNFSPSRNPNPDPNPHLHSPVFVQERLEGENLRVFVVGGRAFAFHLQTERLDYREDPSTVVRSCEVPASISGPTIQMANDLGFDYCALDFRCRSGFDDPIFLEINSFPMFVRFDDVCENRLADAVLQTLCPEFNLSLAPESRTDDC